jgi:NADPH:quinone reductase-like Zn-dependent oxidoreductase
LVAFAELLVKGEVRTTVAGTYALAEAAEAQRLSDAGHAGGKIVLTP